MANLSMSLSSKAFSISYRITIYIELYAMLLLRGGARNVLAGQNAARNIGIVKRARTLKMAEARKQSSWRPRPENVASLPESIAAAPAARRDGLSVRAENVLKQLAAELTGEDPPKGRWIPSAKLLRKLRFGDLAAARNCGAQTTDEIVRWAESQGVLIRRPLHAGKSLSAIWRDIIAKSSTTEITAAEIVEAFERSIRRKNARIPVAFQNILVKVLNSSAG